MSLFNNTTVQSTTPVTTPETTESTTTPVTGDFSKAMESIGVAIGEIRTGLNDLPSNLEKAVTASITSDAVNQAIYDAVASASYDAISDVHADEREYTGLIKKPAVKELSPDEQKDIWIKKLLKVSSADTDQSQRRMMQDLQINFLANLAPDFYKKGAQVFDKILNDELFDALGTELQKAGITGGTGGTGGGQKPEEDSSFFSWKTLARYGGLLLNKIRPRPKPTKPTTTTTKPTKPTKTTNPTKTTKPTKTPTKAPTKVAQDVGKKTVKDIGKKTVQEAGKKTVQETGKKVAQEAGKKAAQEAGKKIATTAAIKGGTALAGKMAVRAIPVVGQIASAAFLASDAYDIGKGAYQLSKAQKESKKTVSGMFEQNDATFAEKHKDNKRLTDANAKLSEASKRTHEITNEWGVLAFGDDVQAAEANGRFQNIMNGKETIPGDEDGKQSLDIQKVKDYVLSEVRGKYTKRLAEAMIDESIASMEYYDALKGTKGPDRTAEGRGEDTANGDMNISATSMPGAPPIEGMPGTHQEQMAAGTTYNASPVTMNAGTGVFNADVMSMDEQMQLYKINVFEGVRDALLLPEVQSVLSNTAQVAGTAVNKSLMGD